MKNIDVTKTVMQKVVRFEERRSRRFLGIFWSVMIVLCSLLSLFLWHAWIIINERGTLDMLALFSEDREIIAEFWQDTVSVMFEELPQKTLIVALIIIVILVGYWIITRRRRRVMKRRLAELAKKSEKGLH